MSREVWHFKRNSDGSYRIMPLHNWNLSLDTDVNTKRVLIWGNHDGDNQKWYIYQCNERYALRPACSDMVLDLKGDNSGDGTPIQLWEKNDSGAQVFDIWPFSSPGSSKLTATAGTASTNTNFNWTKSSDTERYCLKIWKNKAWEGASYKEVTTTGTSLNLILPEGKYQAYSDSCNNYSYTCSNVITINVGPCQHKFGNWSTTKNPTCIEDGSKSRKCSLCGKTETATIAKTGVITVTFNANGGSVAKGNKTVTYNATYGELPTPTRTGYTFNGWYTSANGGNKVDANTKVTITGNQTLYAHWTAKSVSVKFFRNYNENDTFNVTETFTYNVSNQKYGYKTDGTGRYSPMNPANVGFGAWSKTGYEMLGWSGDRNAKSAEFPTYPGINNNWIASQSPSVNRYAVWRAKQYTVAFNANGGSVAKENKTVTYDSTYDDLPTPTRTGYNFSGWFTEQNGGTQIKSDTKVTVASNQTLYAQWKANNYTITFNADGGSVSKESKIVTYDSTYGDLPTPTKTGYTFMGWYDLGKIDANTKVTITKNQTLYAQWKADNHTVAIKGDANGDGTVNVSDAVMLQKWLLAAGDLTKWQNADLCEDGKIDVFDMIEMRKLIAKK